MSQALDLRRAPIRLARDELPVTEQAPVTRGSRRRPMLRLREVIAVNLQRDDEEALRPPLLFMLHWFVAERDLGQLDLDGYADYWGVSARTAYRAQRRFREALPGEHDPNFALWACRHRERAAGWRGLADSYVRIKG